MTVRGLINELEYLDPDMEIVIRDGTYVYTIGDIPLEAITLLPFYGDRDPEIHVIDLGRQIGGWREIE